MDWTQIVLAIVAALTGGGWLFDRQKHRKEVESMEAANRAADMDLAKKYVDEFEATIVGPLKETVEKSAKEVNTLRTAVKRLTHALDKIKDCPHADDCPVYGELQKQQAGDGGGDT